MMFYRLRSRRFSALRMRGHPERGECHSLGHTDHFRRDRFGRRRRCLGMMDRPHEDGMGTLRPEAAGRFDAPAPMVAVIDGDTWRSTARPSVSPTSTPRNWSILRCGRAPNGLRARGRLHAPQVDRHRREEAGLHPGRRDRCFYLPGRLRRSRRGSAGKRLATALPDAPSYYKEAERRAREVPLGIWKGPFVTPGEWRIGKRLPAEIDAVRAASAPTDWPRRIAGVTLLPEPISHRDPCVIKGVVSPTAGRWYFGPLDPGYAMIDAKAGQGRMFCSDDEARSAGWRHGHLALDQRSPIHN